MNSFQSTAAQIVHCAGPIADGKAAIPLRILIVEDERVLAKNMKSYLSRGASDVRIAADAAQALEMLESFAPDSLVVDHGLPGADGLRTYAEIVRHQARKIDCVMITGNPTEQIVQDARDLGIRHIVCKPFRFSELQRLLEESAAATVSDVSDANV
jgi:DNA-binding response OmpR family regulator